MPPPPKHRGREGTVGMPPPEHLLQARAASGGAMAPPEHRLKAPLLGSGVSRGAMVPPERRGKGTGSSGETPLGNLSNLIGSPGFRIKEPPATATQPQRVARERKYNRPWSSSSLRDPSVRTGQQQRSAKTYRRRFSLLSINDAESPTSQAHLRNTAAAAAAAGSFRYSATMLHQLENPGTGLSGGGRMPSSPSASLTGGRMPRSPSTSLSGARMLPSPRSTVKAGAGLSIETPREHQASTGSPREHHAVTGSPREHHTVTGSPQKHQDVTDSPQKHQAVTSSPQKHQAGTGSPREHHAVTGSPQKHHAVTGSPQKHQAVTGSPQKHQAVTGSPRKHQAVAGSPRKHQAALSSLHKHQAATGSPLKHQAAMSSPQKHLNVTGSNGEKPQKHRYVRGSNAETPQKHLQMDRIKDKVGGGLSGEMTQKSYSKERMRPAHHLSSTRRTGTVTELQATSAKRLNKDASFAIKSSHHLSSTRRTGTVTELQATSAKRLNKDASFTIKSSLRTNQNLRRRSSSQLDDSNGLSSDADHGITTAADNKGSTAEEDQYLTEEMIRNRQEVDNAIRQLNELGHGEDISYEEFKGYLERLPCMPHVDTSLRPNYEQLNELQIRNILYHIKYCKFARQKRMNDEMVYKLEDDHPLYHLEEKLECLEEDVSKLEGDSLLYYLEKEGLLRQIQNDELFDWSFHYRTIDGLDDYQRLIPHNYGREYVRWDTYRDYFHGYEIELEYLMYWKELLKELKWMEDYVLLKRPSLKWGKICTRGCYQAIKIASRFSKISESLARAAYYECIDTMCWDILCYKDLDGLYFEIWQRTTMLKENFKEALNEVFKSEKFPVFHQKMKDALENDCSEMEKEFRACTAGITAEMEEDSGRELIADAIKNKRGRPKFYAQYIKKKMEVAKAIGVIPAVVT